MRVFAAGATGAVADPEMKAIPARPIGPPWR